MKRMISLLLVFAMVVGMLPMTAGAAELNETELQAQEVFAENSCGDDLTWAFDEATGTLTIFGSGEMDDYGSTPTPWEDYSSVIKTVHFEEGITYIGENAFHLYDSIISVSLPDSLEKIGLQAFYGCTSLESITIPDGVMSIGNGVFGNCDSLTSVIIPGSVRNLGSGVFIYCDNLSVATIEEGVINIGAQAFRYCSSLERVDIPTTVSSIGSNAFDGCTSLKSVVIPDGVAVIEYQLFNDCSSLKSVTIPDSVESIGYHAFSDCTSLTDIFYEGSEEKWAAITVDTGNEFLTNVTVHFDIEDDDSGNTTQPTTPCEHSYTAEEFPPTCEEQGYTVYTCDRCGHSFVDDYVEAHGHSFGEWYETKASTVDSEGEEQRDCKYCGLSETRTTGKIETEPHKHNYIVKVTAPTCTEQGYTTYTCNSCGDSYTDNYVDANGHSYVDGSCAACGEMDPDYTGDNIIAQGTCGENVYWTMDKDGVLTIWGSGIMTDYDTTSNIVPWYNYRVDIVSVVIEEGVTSIGARAFSICNRLKSIIIPDSVTRIGDYAFYDCSSLTSILIPDGITFIGYRAFYDCSSLMSITIPDGVTNISDEVFAGCSSLMSITIPDSVTGIGQYAFSNCSSLKSIVIPDGVTSINDYVFFGCTSLTSITIPDGVTSIGYSAFNDCRGLTSITIPDGVTSIGALAFSDCSSLTSITLPDSVTSIGNGTFGSCYSLKSVNIPARLISIGNDMFWWCKSLTSITIPDSVTSIGEDAFFSCQALTSITLPSSLTSMGEGVFKDCTSLTSITIPDGVTSIGYLAFNNCSSLMNITIPDSVTSIGTSAFSDCSSLTSIIIPDSVTTIDYGAFNDCSNLVSITIPDSVTSMGNDVFSGCNSLTDIYYAGSEESWAEITNDVDVGIPAGVTIHYNSSGPDSGDTAEGNVHYFAEWDSENQIAYFDIGVLGYQVTDETDRSFISNVDELVGTYVLVESKPGDGLNTMDILISIRPVETLIGNVTDVSIPDEIISIEGVTYSYTVDWIDMAPEIGDVVMFHNLDGKIVGDITELELEMTGTITHWESASRQITINSQQYRVSDYADEVSCEILGESGEKKIFVAFAAHEGILYKLRHYSVENPSINYGGGPDFGQDEDDIAHGYLLDYRDAWEEAYKNFVSVVDKVLKSFSETEEEVRERAISSEAARMKKNDDKSYSTYLTGNLGGYDDEAYYTLAEFMYEYTLNEVPDFSSTNVSEALAGAKIVSKIIGSMSFETYEKIWNGVTISIAASDIMGNNFGTMTIDPHSKGKPTLQVTICATVEDCEETMNAYLQELEDLARNAAYNVATAVYKDILGKPLTSLSKEYVKKVAGAIEKKLAVVLSEKFLKAGVGDLFTTIDTCYTYYSWIAKAVNTGSADDITKTVDYLLNGKFEDKFKDKNVTNDAVNKALKLLKKAAKNMLRAFNEYLDGEIVEKENTLWRIYVECPVNVSVFSSDGTQIGYVGEDDLWYTDAIEINEHGEAKEIMSFTDDLLSLEITATDYGTMSCVFEEYDDAFAPIGRLNYYDIVLTPEQSFAVSLQDDLQNNENSLPIISGEEAYYASEYISVDESARVEISCIAVTEDGTTAGTIYGAGNYIKGDAVVVNAVPYEGFEFIGWFRGELLVGTRESYTLTAREDIELTAKFHKDDYKYIEIIEDEGGSTFGDGRYLSGQTATIIAACEDGFAFDGWYVNDTLMTNMLEYSFTVVDDVTLHAKFYSHTHSYTSHVTSPTCTVPGYTTYTCSCGHSYTGDETEPLGHTAVIDPAVSATCTQTGLTEGSHCSDCGEVLAAQETVPMAEHTWDEGIVTAEPTETKIGMKTYTCTVCGETKTEEIPMLEPASASVMRVAGTSRVDTALEVAEALKEALNVEKFDTIIIANGEDKSFPDALTGSYLATVKKAPILMYRTSGLSESTTAYIRNNLVSGGTVYLLGGELVIPATVETSLTAAGYRVKRLAGGSRFDTNLEILEEAGVGGKEILIARGFEFADSLSASATGLPILMVNEITGKLTDAQLEFLQKYKNNRLTILGGTVAVSEALEATIEGVVGKDVDRVFGTSREATSVEIAKRYFDAPDFAVAAYSRKCPDGLCGGPLAYAMGAPLLLVNAGQESYTRAYTIENKITSGYVLGGTLVISDATARAVFGLPEDAVIEPK